MRYFKIVADGYILLIGTGNVGSYITEEEYKKIMEMIANRPLSSDGKGFRLTADLIWEEYEISGGNTDPDLTDEDALAIILGGAE